MTLIAIVSAKGSPGVSTTALACAMTWPCQQAPALQAAQAAQAMQPAQAVHAGDAVQAALAAAALRSDTVPGGLPALPAGPSAGASSGPSAAVRSHNAAVREEAADRGPVLLAECDPAGGALLAGYLSRYDLPIDRGILPLAGAALRGTADAELPGLVIDLDAGRGERLALPGLTDPAQGASLAPAWGALGEYFGGLSRAGWTVLADCGRLASGFPPWPLLRQADLVLLALRPRSIATISPAVPAVAQLRRELGDGGPALGLLLVGDGTAPREVSRHLMIPVAAEVAWDERTAAALSGLGKGRRRGPLMRSAAGAHRSVLGALAAHRSAQAQLFLQPVTS